MSDFARREVQVRIIRNAHTTTTDENFPRQLMIQVRNRLLHLDEAWQNFNQFHVALLDRDAAENPQLLTEHNQLFDEVQRLFMETQAILRARIMESDQEEQDGEHDLSEIEPEEEPENQVNNHPVPGQLRPQQPPPPTTELQFSSLLQRMCVGLANKKENTWGTYDGDLSQWQGFHDAFKKAVHDDELTTPSTKLQPLKSSLRGDALEKFGQWPGSDNNYFEAWEWLQEQNSRQYHISKKILWKLMNFPKIDHASGFMVEKLCTTAEGHCARPQEYPVEHYDLFFVHCIHDKLDADTFSQIMR